MAWLQTKGPFLFLILLSSGVFLIWTIVLDASENELLLFWVLDVGQGDALFIETPDHYQILIDGGPNARVIEQLGAVMPFWDRTIDLVVLTHPHADHVAGLIEVLKRYEVGAVLESGAAYDTKEYEAWTMARDSEGAAVYQAIVGTRFRFGRDVSLAVLSPTHPASGRRFANVHDANVVALLDYLDTEFLLMGDAEEETERVLMEKNALSDVEVLKVGHHGSRTSSSENFLSWIKPKFALISAGEKNRYGHPHRDVIERFEALKIPVLRTDASGSIQLRSDGTEVYQH